MSLNKNSCINNNKDIINNKNIIPILTNCSKSYNISKCSCLNTYLNDNGSIYYNKIINNYFYNKLINNKFNINIFLLDSYKLFYNKCNYTGYSDGRHYKFIKLMETLVFVPEQLRS